MKNPDPMAQLASAVAFAQDVVELARTHGLIPAQRGRKAKSAAPRKARAPRAAKANGHDTEFNDLTQ